MNIQNLIDINQQNVEKVEYLPEQDKIAAGNPEQGIWNVFSSKDEKFNVGVWDSQAGKWKISYSEDEYCVILEGESIIHDEDGNTKTVKAGDHFMVPAGFSGYWEVPSYCKKIYVVYEA